MYILPGLLIVNLYIYVNMQLSRDKSGLHKVGLEKPITLSCFYAISHMFRVRNTSTVLTFEMIDIYTNINTYIKMQLWGDILATIRRPITKGKYKDLLIKEALPWLLFGYQPLLCSF